MRATGEGKDPLTDEKTERKKDEKEEKKSFFRQLSGNIFDKDVYYAFSVGIHLVLCTFAGLAMGYGLDSLFGTKPWLSFLFLVFGIIAGFRELFRVAKKQGKEDR